MRGVERIVSGTWKENGYLVWSGRDAVAIDPGGEFQRFESLIASRGLSLHAVLNTHAHYDHLGAVQPLVDAFHVPFLLHSADVSLLGRANFYRTLFLGVDPIEIPAVVVELDDGSTLRFGELAVSVLHTPGHTAGSVCFEIAQELFTGDTIMAQALGRTDLPGGDGKQLRASVDRIARTFPARTIIRPGHGEPAELGDALAEVLVSPEARR